MQERLAIIIVGKPNAGKTTTLKHFCNTYHHQKVSTFKMGWRQGFTPFKYLGVKIIPYFLPSSRTEKAIPLSDVFAKLDWWPDFLFMAEQLNGSEYTNTIRFLRKNDYHIKEFLLDNSNTDSIWHFYDKKDEAMILRHRTEQIADYVRGFINARI